MEMKDEMKPDETMVVEKKTYPAPLALHEEVLNNPTLFMETLRHLHTTLGTRFMIPVIGGKELDLHLLYGEVTRRGGLQKAVGEKKWKDVIAAFKFPPTTTSASFVLRKYYISLLHHYEQVYYFRLQGELIPPAVAMPVKSLPCKPSVPDLVESSSAQQQQQVPRKRKRAFSSLQAGENLNCPVVGVIDGKFDNGYFVTVTLGSETLHGVLYQIMPSMSSASSSLVTLENAIVPYGVPCRKRRRRRGRRRDPAHPKPNRSAYNFFFAEKHSKLKLLYPQREREFSKMIGESWNKLTQEERMVYQHWGLLDKERYKREMQEYKEKLKLIQPQEAAIRGPSS